jgi:hypothetical protein
VQRPLTSGRLDATECRQTEVRRQEEIVVVFQLRPDSWKTHAAVFLVDTIHMRHVEGQVVRNTPSAEEERDMLDVLRLAVEEKLKLIPPHALPIIAFAVRAFGLTWKSDLNKQTTTLG